MRGNIKRALRRILPIDAALDIYYTAQAYRKAHGRYPSVLRPRKFSEKIAYRRMFDRRPMLTQFADKCAARDYITARLGARVLPRLHHVTEDPRSIPWDILPERYVVKATHGSGWVRVVTSGVDREALTRQCQEWLGRSYYRHMREWPYKGIPPRIIIEEFIDDGSGCAPADYKLFVFDGRPAFIQVDGTRFSDHRRSFFDLKWQRLPFTLHYQPILHEVARPRHLEPMLEAAARLAAGVDFLRVDFYDTPEQFYVGELTTTPGAGLDVFCPLEADEQVGQLWTPVPLSRALAFRTFAQPG